MKIRTIIITVLLTFIGYCTFIQNVAGNDIQQKDKTIKEFEEIKNLVDSGHYVFRAYIVYPLGYEPIRLTRIDNYLLILGNKAGADLPYFGKAYNITYNEISDGEGKGIFFSGKMKDYKVETDEKKNKINVNFTVDYDGDSFNCILDIYTGGKSTLNVTSQNRSSISYKGNVYLYKRTE